MTIMSNFTSSFVNFDIPNWFDSQHLTGMLRGIEKEGLRVKPDGFLAQTPHPAKLGSKLTHPFITTDYSRPATKQGHTLGLAPSKYSTRLVRRLKLRMSPKYFSFLNSVSV